MQKCVRPVASPGLVVLYPPMPWPPQAASRKMANQVPVLVLYRVTGSPKVLVKGLWPLPAVRRVKVVPPSLENDAPEMLIGLTATPRESLKVTRISLGLFGLDRLYVSDWVMCVPESVCGLIRSLSVPPYARGASAFWIAW